MPTSGRPHCQALSFNVATLYVAEYRTMASVPSATNWAPNAAQGPQEPSIAEQTLSITPSSTASSAFGGYTAIVRLNCDAVCSVVFSTAAQVNTGTLPAATTSNKRLAANQTEYFGVFPGQSVAVIANV